MGVGHPSVASGSSRFVRYREQVRPEAERVGPEYRGVATSGTVRSKILRSVSLFWQEHSKGIRGHH
jgi:hypothetical protein